MSIDSELPLRDSFRMPIPAPKFKQRNRSVLPPALESTFRTYTVSGVAGLGMLCATNAQGAVVYTAAGPGTLTIDLNHDGIVDFGITFFSVHVDSTIEESTSAIAYGQNGIALGFSGYAQAFNVGQEIGPKRTFVEAPATLGLAKYYFYVGPFSTQSDKRGEFLNTKNKFLGLQFTLNGQTFYGWARFDAKLVNREIQFELVDYAYQDEPGRAILAGQGIPKGTEGALGFLALGEPGIKLWRASR